MVLVICATPSVRPSYGPTLMGAPDSWTRFASGLRLEFFLGSVLSSLRRGCSHPPPQEEEDQPWRERGKNENAFIWALFPGCSPQTSGPRFARGPRLKFLPRSATLGANAEGARMPSSEFRLGLGWRVPPGRMPSSSEPRGHHYSR
jgi:hypothetical protein